MEIYVDDTEVNILLTDGTFRPDHVVSVTIDGYPYLPAVIENGVDSPYINLPYKHVQYGGTREIIWTYIVDEDTFTKTQSVNVVTPILPINVIKSIVKPPAYVSGVEELTDAEAVALERRVRYAIEAYTGKFFGTYKGTVIGYVHNNIPSFPYPVIEVTDFIMPYFVHQKVPYVDVKADVIVYPYGRIGGTQFKATGLFGYSSIPTDVAEAAKMLLSDYSCNEANYRQMYVQQIRNADWSFDYRGLAWTGTGNADVDTMLAHYKEHGMVVI